MGKSTFNDRDFIEEAAGNLQGFELRGRFALFLGVLSQVSNDMMTNGTAEYAETADWLTQPHQKGPDGTPLRYLSFDLFCDMVDANDQARLALRSHLSSQPEVIAEACRNLMTTGTDTDFERMRIRLAGLDEPILEDEDALTPYRARSAQKSGWTEAAEGLDEADECESTSTSPVSA